MKFLPSQVDFIYKEIIGVGLSPLMFEVKNGTDHGSWASMIYKAIPDFSFNVAEYSSLSYQVLISPWDEQYQFNQTSIPIKTVLGYSTRWVGYINREIKAKNLWSHLENTINLGTAGYDDHTYFSVHEYEIITVRMKQLKAGISELPLPAEQIKTINGKLDQILEQGKTLGKFDWQAQFVGGLWTLIVTMSVSPEIGKQIFELAKQFFSSVLLLP